MPRAGRLIAILALLLAGVADLRAQDAVPANATDSRGEGRAVNFRLLAPNIASDQKRIWTSPREVIRKRNWLPALAIASVTAGLVATDARTGHYFRNTNTFSGFNSVFTGTATAAAIAVAPAALYAAGSIRRDPYATHTALLAGEALAGGEVVGIVLKDLMRRRRPQDFGLHQDMSGSWFSRTNGLLTGVGSFPSEHSIAAFSTATIVARRYRRHKWIPYAAYGLSTVIGFSRLTTAAHFPSDVFAGAAIGYGIGRFVVLRQ